LNSKIHLYADLPMWQHRDVNQLEMIQDAANIMEQIGFTGSLLFYTHATLDPWIVATSTMQATKTHIPIIALQPYTLPPFTAAKKIHSLTHLFGRRVAINIIPGQSKEEQWQIGNPVGQEERFDRLVEYTEILRILLTTEEPVTYNGKYYRYENLQINAQIRPELQPIIFVAGFSPKFREAAYKIANVAIRAATPVSQMTKSYGQLYNSHVELATRLGLIARPTYEEAIEAAKQSVELRLLQILKRKARLAGEYTEEDERIYYPVEPGKEFRGPLLIGSYDEVANYFRKYVELGIRHVIFSNIRTTEDMHHVRQVLDRSEIGLQRS